MTAALAYAAMILVLAGCCFCWYSVQAGHERLACLRRTAAFRATRAALTVLIAVLSVSAVRGAVVRAWWAWLCRKPPARREGKLNRADYLTFIGLVEMFRHDMTPAERSRT